MHITVNGKSSDMAEGTSIVTLLGQYNITSPMTIVEVNEAVVPNDQWESHPIADGDNIEIIQLMGGG